jgi:hypothetical protein
MKIQDIYHETNPGRYEPGTGYGDLGEGGKVEGLLGVDFSGDPADGQIPFYNATTGELDWVSLLGLFGAVISPAALAANTDDWNPAGLATAAVIRADLSAAWNLTGIVAPAATGQRTAILLANVSAFALTLKHDVTSTAANRFSLPSSADVALAANTAVLLWYDPTTLRWRLAGGSGGGGSAEVWPAPLSARYTFDSATADADPGAGKLRLSNATQYLAVTCRAEILDADGASVAAMLDEIGNAVSSVKGYLRLQHETDPTKWLTATVSAIASPPGYRNVTIANIAKSANSPFAAGDKLVLTFVPGALALPHSATTGQTANDHHAQLHHAAHEPGGGDAMAVDAAAATGSLRTLGTGGSQAAPGNDARFTPPKHIINFVIDGGSATITTGSKIYVRVPFACTVTRATLLADQSGSIVVDVRKCSYANFDAGATHPVSGDSICAAAKPTITTATKSDDATLTGWTTAVSAGDILEVSVDSATTIRRVTLALEVQP